MSAALRLSWYKAKHAWGDFIKVLLGILAFEVLILFIEKKGFLVNFEQTRMTLFLLIFSSSLLVLVQTSIYISKERTILDRDFFSALDPRAFAFSTLLFNTIYAGIEALVFNWGYQLISQWFNKELEVEGIIFKSFGLEVTLTIFLIFLASHFLGLLISALVGDNEITSVILAVVAGIAQFSLSGTILRLPESIEKMQNFIFLSMGHRLFSATNKLETIPGSMAKYHIPVEKWSLDLFKLSSGDMWRGYIILLLHALVYAGLFVIALSIKKEKSR